MKLYYHKTDGGAEYLFDTFVKWKHNGKSGKEGVINDKTKIVVRLDGKQPELTIKDNPAPELLAALRNARIALVFYRSEMADDNPGKNKTYPFGIDCEAEARAAIAKAEGRE